MICILLGNCSVFVDELGIIALLKPKLAASFRREAICLDARSSPERPISPISTVSEMRG